MIHIQMITGLLVLCAFRCEESYYFAVNEKVRQNLFIASEKFANDPSYAGQQNKPRIDRNQRESFLQLETGRCMEAFV